MCSHQRIFFPQRLIDILSSQRKKEAGPAMFVRLCKVLKRRKVAAVRSRQCNANEELTSRCSMPAPSPSPSTPLARLDSVLMSDRDSWDGQPPAYTPPHDRVGLRCPHTSSPPVERSFAPPLFRPARRAVVMNSIDTTIQHAEEMAKLQAEHDKLAGLLESVENEALAARNLQDVTAQKLHVARNAAARLQENIELQQVNKNLTEMVDQRRSQWMSRKAQGGACPSRCACNPGGGRSSASEDGSDSQRLHRQTARFGDE